MSQPSSEVVYVPQRSGASWLFPVNVLDVVLMGYRHQTRWLPFGQSAKARAMKALEQVGMAAHARVQIGQLSGGQQQRVFLARALVQRGAMYLLDEPFAGVDIPTQELLVRLFERLRASGRTIIYATHDLDQAAISSDRVVLINHRLVASGAPGRVLTEANIRETFGGRVFVVPGTAPSEVQQQ